MLYRKPTCSFIDFECGWQLLISKWNDIGANLVDVGSESLPRTPSLIYDLHHFNPI